MDEQLSAAQEAVVAKLEKLGFRVNSVTPFEGEPNPTVFMSKRVRSFGTRYAEVGPDATVNGVDVDKYILDYKASL